MAKSAREERGKSSKSEKRRRANKKAGRTKPAKAKKLNSEFYENELARLQTEMVKLQEWIRHEGLKVVCVFEGRDAAGKGGVIKRITDSLNPRVCKVVALPTPTEREKNQWYFQRYVNHHCCPVNIQSSAS